MNNISEATNEERHYGMCYLSVCNIYRKADDTSPLLGQMLFGECCDIITIRSKWWIRVEFKPLDIIGWIDARQLIIITAKQMAKYQQHTAVCGDLVYPLLSEKYPTIISQGAHLPQFDGLMFKTPFEKYVFNGTAITDDNVDVSENILTKMALKWFNVPEMPFGRSPFGIDPIYFILLIFKTCKVDLPRHLPLLLEKGEFVDFMDFIKEGDIAFFLDKNEELHHIGLCLGNKRIIHVFGKVRIDELDRHGIWNVDSRRYTHKLKYVKRMR